MKKMTRLLVALIGTFTILAFLTACGSDNSSDKNNGSSVSDPKDPEKDEPEETPKVETQTIKVISDGQETSYDIVIGSKAQIDVISKPGYYFVGAYDKYVGGTQYFDSNGHAVMNSWSKGCPNTYYARFESIYDLTFNQVLRDEDPYSWVDGLVSFEFSLSEEMQKAINANLDANLNVTISFDGKHTNGYGWTRGFLSNLKTGGEHFYLFGEDDGDGATCLGKSQYETLSRDFTIKAKLLKDGKLYLYLDTPLIIMRSWKYSVKNLNLTISFAQE